MINLFIERTKTESNSYNKAARRKQKKKKLKEFYIYMSDWLDRGLTGYTCVRREHRQVSRG